MSHPYERSITLNGELLVISRLTTHLIEAFMATPSTTRENTLATDIKLTATQAEVLKAATYRPDGNIEPLPPALRGGARAKVIEGLLTRALITADNDSHLLTDAGYAAVGRKRKAPEPVTAEAQVNAAIADTEATAAQEKQAAAKRLLKVGVKGKPRTRENTKQALVIEMLRRSEGTTIRQIVEATGWQAHTVRGTFAGAFKKKLGLTLTSEKTEGSDRTYRIA